MTFKDQRINSGKYLTGPGFKPTTTRQSRVTVSQDQSMTNSRVIHAYSVPEFPLVAGTRSRGWLDSDPRGWQIDPSRRPSTITPIRHYVLLSLSTPYTPTCKCSNLFICETKDIFENYFHVCGFINCSCEDMERKFSAFQIKYPLVKLQNYSSIQLLRKFKSKLKF